MRRFWTAEEDGLLLAWYGQCPAAEFADLLGRGLRDVYRRALHLGLRKGPPRTTTAQVGEVARLHGEGLTDAEIGRRLGIQRRTVQDIRRERLGLPVNAAAVKEAGRRAVQAQRRTLGVKSGGDLRRLGFRNYAAENGWPEDLRPREVQILNVLAGRGVPMTRPELAEAIGHGTAERWASGKRRILLAGNGPGGTYTASLMRRGLVACLGRLGTVTGQGKGRSRYLYTLGPQALAILERRADQCQTESGAGSSV